jgi:hypothetical protein
VKGYPGSAETTRHSRAPPAPAQSEPDDLARAEALGRLIAAGIDARPLSSQAGAQDDPGAGGIPEALDGAGRAAHELGESLRVWAVGAELELART